MFRKSNKRGSRPDRGDGGPGEPPHGPAGPPWSAGPPPFPPGPHDPHHGPTPEPGFPGGPRPGGGFGGPPPGEYDTTELAAVGGRGGDPRDRRDDTPPEDDESLDTLPEDDDGPRLPPPPPVPRLRSMVAAAFTVLLSAGLLLGAQMDRPGFAVVCLGVQVLFAAAWAYGSQPPGPWVVGFVGIAAGFAADGLAVYARPASLEPLGYVVVGGLFVGVVGQITRGVGRSRVTESLGTTIAVVIAVVGLATPILLTRHPGGREALAACLLATGTALVVARLADLVLPWPRITPQVPRGAIGIVAGTMAGTGAAACAGWLLMGVSTGLAAFGGLLVALLALLSDLGMAYAETGRRLAGAPTDGPRPWVRLALGPLVALSVAAPATYLLGVLLLDAA